MKIFDCFTFFNELDLLEFRLRLLDRYVDYFVIAESNLTHSGEFKGYNYVKNRERYKTWADKIIFIQVKQDASNFNFSKIDTSYNVENGSWHLEQEQRRALADAGKHISNEDTVLVSDLDEIPNPYILKNIRKAKLPASLQMRMHYYYFNCESTKIDKWWNGTVVASGEYFKEQGPQKMRDERNELKKIKKAGWHFSFLGGVDKIAQKISSFAHTEYNKPEYLDRQHIEKAIKKGDDIFKRKGMSFRTVSLYKYPLFLRSLMKDYPKFIKQTGPFADFKSFFQRLF